MSGLKVNTTHVHNARAYEHTYTCAHLHINVLVHHNKLKVKQTGKNCLPVKLKRAKYGKFPPDKFNY